MAKKDAGDLKGSKGHPPKRARGITFSKTYGDGKSCSQKKKFGGPRVLRAQSIIKIKYGLQESPSNVKTPPL